MLKKLLLLFLISFSAFTILVSAESTCERDADIGKNKTQALIYKLIALATILVAGALGVSLPFLGKIIPALSPEKDIFFIVKAFAAGVILSTGMVHILPDAFESLSSPCLSENPWGNFPFSGFIAMLSAIGTLMVDTFANSYYKRSHFLKSKPINSDEENQAEHAGHVHLHTHATHGHSHGPALEDSDSSNLIRHRIVSKVLELGIVVHSVIIGVSLGASQNPKEIKPLVAALTFHQLFEGMGLGGCISQAKFKLKVISVMAIFFTLTTPIGIAIGFGISNIYDENSPTALIVEGVFNSASAGILIYMALVDLLSADFMNPKLQSNPKLLFGAQVSLLFGAGCMSLLAKWA